jgi:NADPH2:quinone reductase
MKAIQAAERGGYEELRLADLPPPQPQRGQSLVRVTSAGVTPLDHAVLAGLHPTARKLPLVPGNEGAGVVLEDPSGRFSAGQRVLFFAGPGGLTQDGTFAEMTSVPSGNLAALPREIADEIAGGLPVAYLSAFLALAQAGFRAGQSVLARLAPGGVDVVIDALGGPLTGQAVGGLARHGRVVVTGYAAGTETTMRVTDLVWKLARVSGFSLFAASAQEQAAEALRHLIEDRPFGKVTVSIEHNHEGIT